MVEEGEGERVQQQGTGVAQHGQQRRQPCEGHLQRRGGDHRHDQQEADGQHHAQREHPLLQPRHQAVQTLRVGAEDQIQRTLQLGEDHGRADQQQRGAPQPRQRAQVGTGVGVADHGGGHGGGIGAGKLANLVQQRLLCGRVQRGRQPQQQDQQRRQRKQRIERQRRGLRHQIGLDEAAHQCYGQAALGARTQPLQVLPDGGKADRRVHGPRVARRVSALR